MISRMLRFALGEQRSRAFFDFMLYHRDVVHIRYWSCTARTLWYNLRKPHNNGHPPHKSHLYRELIETFIKRSYSFIPIKAVLENQPEPDKISIYLRHDCDIKPQNLEILCQIEQFYHLKSAIYLIVKNPVYKIEDFRNYLLDIRADGFEIGLHSVAWDEFSAEKQKQVFIYENRKFEEIFGFQASSFTFHGKGVEAKTNPHESRKAFLRLLPELEELYPKYYGLMVDLRQKKVSIKISDSEGIPWPSSPIQVPLLYPGYYYCVLTHPCYWV